MSNLRLLKSLLFTLFCALAVQVEAAQSENDLLDQLRADYAALLDARVEFEEMEEELEEVEEELEEVKDELDDVIAKAKKAEKKTKKARKKAKKKTKKVVKKTEEVELPPIMRAI